MATSAVGRRLERGVERACAADGDARALQTALLPVLAAAVRVDAYAFVLTDPETAVGSAPLADVPSMAELPRLIRLRYLTPVNRWTSLVDPPVAVLSDVTGGDLGRSLVWRELMRHHGVSDVVTAVFRDRHGCWAFLDLWRTDGRTFSPAEAADLAQVVPAVTTALRERVARAFPLVPAGRSPSAGPLVLLLTPDLDVVHRTPGTDEALRRLLPRADGRPAVPAGAYNVAAQLLAVEAGVDDAPPSARVHLPDGSWLMFRAARMDDGDAAAHADIAVTIEPCPPAERLSLFVRAAGLSPREGELLAHLATGVDSRDLAERMSLSVNTVQDHLKSVFTKTGTRNRRALLARVLGG